MPISKRPLKTTFENPTAQIFEDVDGEDNKPLENDRVAELEAALKQLREQREEERSDALLSQPSNQGWQSQVSDRPAVVDPKTIQLPDPALDPDGYAVAVQRRVELASDNKRRDEDNRRKFEDDIDTKTAELWSDFGDAYPEISDDRERVDFVATSVVKAAVKKGLDINRYMFGTGRARFMKDVANKYESVFGEPEPVEDDYEDSPRSRRSEARSTRRARTSNRSRTEDDEGRSTGVFGGNESGGSPNRRNVDDETGPSMIDDIHAMQKKTGFW